MCKPQLLESLVGYIKLWVNKDKSFLCTYGKGDNAVALVSIFNVKTGGLPFKC